MKDEMKVKYDSCILGAKVRHVKQGFTMFVAQKSNIVYCDGKRCDDYKIGLSESLEKASALDLLDMNSDYNKNIKEIPLDVFLSEWEVIK